MSEHDEQQRDTTGLGWVLIVVAAILFATMPITIAVFKYVL
ncbi:MAG: hypothetical protein OFPII_13050 [Osedax symbiont Rs1]|nr:MAG: hypothetical protein OFPII_13050 [Osedax symbiont Rs1]